MALAAGEHLDQDDSSHRLVPEAWAKCGSRVIRSSPGRDERILRGLVPTVKKVTGSIWLLDGVEE